MASFHSDQAEGLRRMLAGPKPRIFTFLSALPDEEKNAMLVNLGSTLVRSGSDVLLLDARAAMGGIGTHLGAMPKASLLEVARRERQANDAVLAVPPGFRAARLAHATTQARALLQEVRADRLQLSRLAQTFDALAKQADVVMIDGDLDRDDCLPLPALAASEIVVQVAGNAASIKSAYALIKRLTASHGRRSCSILVCGANEKEAKVVYENIAQAASRYLATPVAFLGAIPADEHLKRAASLGRTVVDAFPLAGASIAFRRLAGRCALSEMPAIGQPKAA